MQEVGAVKPTGGPWRCLPGCEKDAHEHGWTADDRFGECYAETETGGERNVRTSDGFSNWSVRAYECATEGRATAAAVHMLVEMPQGEVAVLEPWRARQIAGALLAAAHIAERGTTGLLLREVR